MQPEFVAIAQKIWYAMKYKRKGGRFDRAAQKMAEMEAEL